MTQGDVEKLQNYAKLTNQTGSHLLRYTDIPSILQPNILEASPTTHHIGCDSMMSYTIWTMVEIVFWSSLSSLTSGPEKSITAVMIMFWYNIWLDQPSFTFFPPKPRCNSSQSSPTSPWDENPICTKELNERLRQCKLFFFGRFGCWWFNDGYFGSCSSGRGGCWQNSDQPLKSHWFSSGKGLPIDPETRDVSFDDCLPCIIALEKILNNHGLKSTVTALITYVVKETWYFLLNNCMFLTCSLHPATQV